MQETVEGRREANTFAQEQTSAWLLAADPWLLSIVWVHSYLRPGDVITE